MRADDRTNSESMENEEFHLKGSFRILQLYDVAEAIDVAKARQILGPACMPETRTFPRRTPEYVRFAQPPVIEPRAPLTLSTGEQLVCSVKYYEFAAIVVEIEAPFAGTCHELQQQAARWMDSAEIDAAAREIARSHLQRVDAAVTRPTHRWLEESYVVINVQSAESAGTSPVSAAELVQSCGAQIVQLIRGETAKLANKSVEEALGESLSYYEADLVVVGASAAFVYDRAEDAAATAQVLEFAKMQLLEFRYYDDLMSGLLTNIYTMLDRKRNIVFSRWTLPRDAKHVNAIRLDVMDLTERVDNSIKFISDAYYARVYRLAAKRTGVNEYRQLVDEKLHTAGELYEFMVDQFNETRSFVIEVAVGILALLDVIFWLKH